MGGQYQPIGQSHVLQNIIDYITIASTGNASDFGDSVDTATGRSKGVSSDSHSGLPN